MDFNFPQHLLPLLLLNTAFFGFLQYIDRVYKEAFKEVQDMVHASKFNPDDNKNESKIYKKIKGLYDELTNPTKIDTTDLNKAYVYVFIGLMLIYLLYFGFCLLSYQINLNILWILSLSLCILALLVIIYYTKERADKMRRQIDRLRDQRKEFLDLLDAHRSDEKRYGESKS